jgi:hypothetical protein
MKKSYSLILAFGFLAGCGQANHASSTQSIQGSSPGATSSQVELNWTSNRGEQQGFDIEESSDGANFTQIQTVLDGTNTAAITVANPSLKYYFRIRSYNQAGFSSYSPVVIKGI